MARISSIPGSSVLPHPIIPRWHLPSWLNTAAAAAQPSKLIFNGTKVPATIDMVDNYERQNRIFTREEAHNLRVRYTAPGGRVIKTELALPATSVADHIMVGDQVELRIDPDDPESITLQTQPRSWAAALAVVILLTPLSGLL